MNNPIGVFDSGVGGLTVAQELINKLPNETIYFFGDTKNCPYGEKNKEELIKYSKEAIEFFISKNVKMIVFACNTVTAAALSTFKNQYNIPIIGVIEEGVKKAVKTTKTKNVLVLGTKFTINSKIYNKELQKQGKNIITHSKICSKFVKIIESGEYENKNITDNTIIEELKDIDIKNIDTVILGCTHYPIIQKEINNYYNNKFNLISPGKETVNLIEEILKNKNNLSTKKFLEDKLFITKESIPFRKTAKKLISENIKITVI